jgi:hypothetical protein
MTRVKDGHIYIVSQCDWIDVCDDWHIMPQGSNGNYTYDFNELSHWMPLPSPPEPINEI